MNLARVGNIRVFDPAIASREEAALKTEPLRQGPGWERPYRRALSNQKSRDQREREIQRGCDANMDPKISQGPQRPTAPLP